MVDFSIIIPVYNAEKYLRTCLDSVLAQTYSSWECICVDDGSTDGSREILCEYQMKESPGNGFFRVIHQKNAGVSVARNVGLELTQGRYICFVDADDTVQTDWLMKYAMMFKNTGADVVRLLDGKSWVLDGFPWKYSIKREIAIKARFPEGVMMSEDGLYVARVLPYVVKIAVLGEMTYNYHVRPGTAMLRPLSSAERLRYFIVLREIAEQNVGLENADISNLCAGGVLTWLNRPKDLTHADEIRQEWLTLRDLGCAQLDAVRPLFRLAYGVYALTGWLWPTRLILYVLATGVSIKNSVKKIGR